VIKVKGRIRIKVMGYLINLLGFDETVMEVKVPVKIKEIISIPKEVYDRTIILVNGKSVSLDDEVKDGDEIVVMPFVSGG